MKKISRVIAIGVLALAATSVATAADLRISYGSHAPCLNPGDSVSIVLSSFSGQIGGFNLALGLSEAAGSFVAVHPGAFINSCQWEYLSWRVDRQTPIVTPPPFGEAPLSHTTAVLEITGVASVSPQHAPLCLGGAGDLELARVLFLVAEAVNGRPTGCEYLPVRFYWRDCRDNILLSQHSDTAFGVSQVNEQAGVTPPQFSFPGNGAPSGLCDTVSSRHYVANLTAYNGGFDIVCTDSVCYRGDLNLNGYPGEIADVVLFERFFQVGIIAFRPPSDIDAIIAQSDVNGDGITLTVADLVYLIRKVVGDI